MSKLTQLLREETIGLHGRLLLAQLLTAPLPIHTGFRVRALALRLVGFRIGRGVLIYGMPTITGPRHLCGRLTVGSLTRINVGCTMDLGAPITIGDQVSLGQHVMLLTTSHEMGAAGRRAAAAYTQPIVIESGAWLAARSLILPGVTIGAGAVVAAGAVVNKDVPANTVVGGVPARLLRELTLEKPG